MSTATVTECTHLADVAKAYIEAVIEEPHVFDGGHEGLVINEGDGKPLPHGHPDKPLPLAAGDDDRVRSWLRGWNVDECFAQFVVERAGLRFELDVEQNLRGVKVKLWLGDDGDYLVVICSGWPRSTDPDEQTPAPKSLMLPELFAIAESGKMHSLRRPELRRWGVRALVEAGLIPPPAPAPLAPLVDPSAPAQRTWRVIAELVAVRSLTGTPGDPVPLSTPWLSGWSGIPEPVLRSGKRWLARRGYIEKVGEVEVGKTRPLYLWRLAMAVDGRAS